MYNSILLLLNAIIIIDLDTSYSNIIDLKYSKLRAAINKFVDDVKLLLRFVVRFSHNFCWLMNFYCTLAGPEYIKLRDFHRENQKKK